jgi:hypothetical protein
VRSSFRKSPRPRNAIIRNRLVEPSRLGSWWLVHPTFSVYPKCSFFACLYP